jgi:hypothetical protein
MRFSEIKSHVSNFRVVIAGLEDLAQTVPFLKKFSFKMRIIKINRILVSKEEYDTTFIHKGDEVQMLFHMSGG